MNKDNRLSGDTPLRQSQLVLLRLLQAFDQICKQNKFDYWLDSGTLIGAVRHQGFIPWDDDIDVVMPYEHYVQFCALLENNKDILPFDMFYQCEKTDIDYICHWVKIRDRFSFLEEAGGPYPYSQAISIDIFPMDLLTERQQKYRNWYHFLPPYNHKPERIVKHLSVLSKCRILVQSTYQWLFVGISKIPFISKALVSWFTSNSKSEKKWGYISPIRWKVTFSNDWIYPLKPIAFEGIEFLGPNNPDAYLTEYYGDYMTPPPVENRVSEHAVTGIYPTGPNPHFSALKWEDYYENR